MTEQTNTEQSESRRKELMRLLAEEGAARCTYLPGAGHPDEWAKPTTRCDCKFRPFVLAERQTSEQTGCCEMRTAYWVLSGEEGTRS